MMNWLEDIPEHFVRTYDRPFDVADFCRIMRASGLSLDKSTAADYLITNPLLFGLTDGTFVTKASVFNGYTFSFKPTREELQAGAFFAGHRCVPFTDFEKLPIDFTFVYRGHKLKKKVCQFKSDVVLDHFALFGEEYALQYIATDPACTNLDLTDIDFVVPNMLQITCFSISELLSDGLKYGDSIILRIMDWDEGIIALDIRPNEKKSPFEAESYEKTLWYKTLEDGLLSSFDRLGPGCSIEEQLSNVFFEKRDILDSIECGSVEEFLARSEKVSFEYFGVETRLWRAGETVPAVGDWNYSENDVFSKNDFLILPPFVFDCFILDEIFARNGDFESLPKMIYPRDFSFQNFELKAVLKELKTRAAKLKKEYNSFADYDNISLRHRTIVLFQEISSLMYKIDTAVSNLKAMPQQEMVILTQLYAHIMSIMQVLAVPGELSEDYDMLEASIEGMEYNFDDIIDILNDAVARQHNNSYAII